MFLVICHLLLATTIGLVNGLLHRFSDGLSIHNGESMHVAGSTSDNLDERTMVTKKSLIVCIKNGNERHFGNIKTFTQKINTNEHIIGAGSEIIDDINTIKSINIGMNVVSLDTYIIKEARHFFCLTFGGSDDESALPRLIALMYLFNKVVHKIEFGTHLDGGIQQSCGTNQLLNNHTFSTLQFILGRSG